MSKIKISGIHMTINEWLEMLAEPYYSEAMEISKTQRINSVQTVNSLYSALSHLSWPPKEKTKADWLQITRDLANGIRKDYIYQNIIQLVQ